MIKRTDTDNPISLTSKESNQGWATPEVVINRSTVHGHTGWLTTVTTSPKKNIRSITAVPPEVVILTPLRSSTERPKTLNPDDTVGPWYPPLTDSYLLQLPDGFIGDNVIFDNEHYYGLGNWWLGDQEDAWRLYENVREVRHIDAGISITAWGGEAFQHFILDTLPRLSIYFDLVTQPKYTNLKLVSHKDACPTAQWFWNKLELQNQIIQKPKTADEGFVIHADLALYQNWHPNPGNYGIHPRGSLGPVQQRLGINDGTPQDLVLYLGRYRCARSVGNDEALLRRLRDVLKGSGLRLHEFKASGNLDQDMQLVKRARIILGPHGGAFANLVFAQPGTHVIEFLPTYRLYREGADPLPYYWGLAQSASLDYWCVEPLTFEFDQPNMAVDIEEVVALVDRLIGGTT